MPRYYFDLKDSLGLTRDEEGREMPDLEAARREAISQVRPIIAEGVREGHLDLRGCILLRREDSDHEIEIRFDEVVKVTFPPLATDKDGHGR